MLAALKRSLFVCGTLWFMTTFAFGDASYQHTRDGKTIVWNNLPKPGDEASWSGRRDREGYAKGFGTLTWYTAQPGRGTTSAIYARYFGNMGRGKFIGPVNAHSKRKTAHALFVNGKRTTRWTSGPAPSWKVVQAPITPTKSIPVADPEAPGEGSPVIAQTKPAAAQNDVKRQIENTPPARKTGFDDFLRVLVEPPSTLRARRQSGRTPDTGPHLSKDDVIELADAEARMRGYDPANYQPAEPQYNATNKTWSLSYDQRPFNAMDEPGNHFRIVIDDKTKGGMFLLGK